MQEVWVLIDNYDSFTHILADYLLRLNEQLIIIRNDEGCLDDIIALHPTRIIISPGPKRPQDAGCTMAVIAYFADKCPVLGICLGHQALGEFWGCKLIHAPFPMHGKVSILKMESDRHWLFENITGPVKVMRYHSLCLQLINQDPNIMLVASSEDDNCIMVLQHKKYKCLGLQFHPESVLTTNGFTMLKNWDKWCLES